MITKFVSIKYTISKLYRDLGINHEIPEGDIIEWCAEALSLIGAYGQYEEISDCLELVNGKAKLPCGFEKLVDINYRNNPVYWATNTNANNYQCSGCKIPTCQDGTCTYTFYINDNYIISNITTNGVMFDTNGNIQSNFTDNTSNNTTNICIVYLGIPTDDDGYPLIPDDIYYQKALTAYVTMMVDKQDWRKGKLPDKIWMNSENDWFYYVNSARGSANMPNLAQLENLKNVWKRLLPTVNEYKKGFVNFNKEEKLNRK